MKNLMAFCLLMMISSTCYANEWVPYRYYAPITQPFVPPVQYPVAPVQVVVPLWVPYVPVVTYDSIVVEHKQWCLFKRYDIVNIPRVVYVPAKY